MGQLEKKRIAANRLPKLLSKNSGMKSSKIFLFVIFFIHVPLVSVTFPLLVGGVYMSMSPHCFIIVLRGIPYGLAVRIPGFHPGGPGSTPGMGIHFLSVQTMFLSVTQAS